MLSGNRNGSSRELPIPWQHAVLHSVRGHWQGEGPQVGIPIVFRGLSHGALEAGKLFALRLESPLDTQLDRDIKCHGRV